MRTFEELVNGGQCNNHNVIIDYKQFILSCLNGDNDNTNAGLIGWLGENFEHLRNDENIRTELEYIAESYRRQRNNGDEDFERRRAYDERNFNNFYFARYGMAYVYMYSLIYDIVIKSADASTPLNVLSLGCGGFVDKAGLDFAHAYFRDREDYGGGIRYTGVDRSAWTVRCYSDAQIHDENNNFRFETSDIAEYIAGLDSLDHNVLMFPLIINELDQAARQALLDAFGRPELNFSQNEYYICVSHAKSQVRADAAFVDDIVNIFVENGFTAESNIYNLMPPRAANQRAQSEYFKDLWVKEKTFIYDEDGNCSVTALEIDNEQEADLIVSITPPGETGNADFTECDRSIQNDGLHCNLYAYRSAARAAANTSGKEFLPWANYAEAEVRMKNSNFLLRDLEDVKRYMSDLSDILNEGRDQNNRLPANLSNRVTNMFFQVIRLRRQPPQA